MWVEGSEDLRSNSMTTRGLRFATVGIEERKWTGLRSSRWSIAAVGEPCAYTTTPMADRRGIGIDGE